jgi:Zn-dependent peptidase ImmA (M78 family)/DNA-binding XRE family transcriptional regulator
MNAANQNFFGVRLKLARKMAGMSLQELSDVLGNLVTKQALNKYEQGLMNPSSEVLLALSKSLKVKPDFFLKKDPIEVRDISFRKKETLSKKIEESIIEKAKDYVERFFELENILGINENFKNPVKDLIIQTKAETENAAKILRKTWELGNNPISNLVEMLELKGIKLLLIEEVEDIDGFSFFTSNFTPVVIVNTRSKSIERIRFTIIHELAHLLLRFKEEIGSDRKEIEKLCHHFSSCFLIPSEKLIELIGGKHRSYINIKELITIKSYYGISIRAIVHRLETLGVISQSYYQRWMIYMSKTYGQKNEPGNYIGEEKLCAFERLIIRALAEDLISVSKAASLMNTSINEIRKWNIGVK